MNNKLLLPLFLLIGAMIVVSCGSPSSPTLEMPAPQIVEVTRIVPQTVEVTRIPVNPSATPTPSTATPEPETAPRVEVNGVPIRLDPAYFDGMVVITQYYTYLDQGLNDQANALKSSSYLKLNNGANRPRSITIRAIVPYNYNLALYGSPVEPVPENELRYIIGITEINKGKGWEPTPYPLTVFVSLVLEDGSWKVNETNSSPWFE